MQQRKCQATLTGAEAEVMNVIWQISPVTVPDIVDRLPRKLAYTTVMTTVNILEEKGFIDRNGKRGRAIIYRPTVSLDEVRCSMARQLAQTLFGGSIKSMVLSLMNEDSIKTDEIAEVKEMIKELESAK